MYNRRTNSGWALVGKSNFGSGKKKRYFVESWSAVMAPNGRVEPACLTLSHTEGGPPMHHINCDTMKRINPTQSTRSILIENNDSSTVDIVLDDDHSWRMWTKHIGLLLTISLYPIPVEPKAVLNKLPPEFKSNLDAKHYDPQGVMAWGVCVLGEGVGSKAGISQACCAVVITATEQIKVFPYNVTSHTIISWDRDKLRRSGSIGGLVFLEAGRRCTFGAGLLWMYAFPEVTHSLRDGLHTFLFRGCQMVAENVRRASQVSISSTRSSGDSASFDAGSFPERSNSGSSNVSLVRQNSTLSSSGFHDSGFSKSPSSVGPPVNLHSHPSLRRKNHSPNYQYRREHSTRSETDDDPIEADLVEHDGRSRTLPSRQYSQHSIGMATTFEIEDDTDSKRKGFIEREDIGYVEMRTSLSPPKRDTYEDMSEMIMSRRGSDSPPRGTPVSYQNVDLTEPSQFPKSQERLLSGLRDMTIYNTLPTKVPSGYDNIKLKSRISYENV